MSILDRNSLRVRLDHVESSDSSNPSVIDRVRSFVNIIRAKESRTPVSLISPNVSKFLKSNEIKFHRKLINKRRSIVFGKIGILLLYETRWHNESRKYLDPRYAQVRSMLIFLKHFLKNDNPMR